MQLKSLSHCLLPYKDMAGKLTSRAKRSVTSQSLSDVACLSYKILSCVIAHLLSIERCDWSKQQDMFCFVPQLPVKLMRRYLSFMAMLLLV